MNDSSEKTAPKSTPIKNKKSAGARKIRVLLVEDDALVRMVGANLLSNHGCEVDIAETGEKALKLAEKNVYDLVLMDLGLPGIDGFETTKALRATKHIMPIIALTAHGDDEHRRQCTEAGMNELVSKANFTDEVETILKTWCHSA